MSMIMLTQILRSWDIIISFSVFWNLFLNSSLVSLFASSSSQSLYGKEQWIFCTTCISLLKVLPSSLNSCDVNNFTIIMDTAWKNIMKAKVKNVHFNVRPVYSVYGGGVGSFTSA